jgi:hypothetical protein
VRKNTSVAELFERHLGVGLSEFLDQWRSWASSQEPGPHEPPPESLRDVLRNRILPLVRDDLEPLPERIAAVRDMGRAGFVSGADALIDLVAAGNPSLRREAVWALEAISGEPLGDNPRVLMNIQQALLEELRLVDDYSAVITRRTPRRLKYFAMPTRTAISNDMISGYTVLEVISPDRPGLLACIGRIFMQFGIQLQNAKIATLGERVEDIFFITDSKGQPLSDPALCESLQQEICQQLDKRVSA